MKHTVDSYLDELEARLAPLPETKRKEIVREYRSHFDSAATEGVNADAVLKSLVRPTRLSDSILRSHGVFDHAEKWQVRWLIAYCLVVAILVGYMLTFSVGPVRIQALPLYFCLSTLWGFGCLPYYVACLKSRRFLWKPFLAACVVITGAIWGNFSVRASIIHGRIASSFVADDLRHAHPSELKEFSDAILKLASYGKGSGSGHFSWLYEENRPALNRGTHLVTSPSEKGQFLIPDSHPDREQPVKFSIVDDPKVASLRWSENKDRLERFAWNAGIIAKTKELNEYPVPLFHIKHFPAMLRYSAYIFLPLGILGLLFSSFRPPTWRSRRLA